MTSLPLSSPIRPHHNRRMSSFVPAPFNSPTHHAIEQAADRSNRPSLDTIAHLTSPKRDAQSSPLHQSSAQPSTHSPANRNATTRRRASTAAAAASDSPSESRNAEHRDTASTATGTTLHSNSKKQKRNNNNTIVRINRSMYCFTLSSPFRQHCIDLVNASWFRWFVRLVALTNCGVQAWDTTRVNRDHEPQDDVLMIVRACYAAWFVAEAMLRIVAHGLILNGHTSYLRTWFGCIDAWVAVCACVTVDSNIGYLRIFLPLKALSCYTGIRVLVKSLLLSLSGIRDVFVLVMTVLFFFALVGQTLYAGTLRNQCFPLDPTTGAIDYSAGGQVLVDGQPPQPCSVQTNGFMGVTGRQCPRGYACADSGSNPENGVIGFDSSLQGWVNNVICITGEGWTEIMYDTEDANTRWAQVYFMLLMILVFMFLSSLIIVIMTNRFDEVKISEKDKAIKAKKSLLLRRQKARSRIQRRQLERARTRNQDGAESSSSDDDDHHTKDAKGTISIAAGAAPSSKVITPENELDTAANSNANALHQTTASPRRIASLPSSPVPTTPHLLHAARHRHPTVRRQYRSWRQRLHHFLSESYYSTSQRSLFNRRHPSIHRFMSTYGEVAFGLLTIANVVELSVFHFGMSDQQYYILYVSNIVFTSLFIAELPLKILAVGCKEFVLGPLVPIVASVPPGASGIKRNSSSGTLLQQQQDAALPLVAGDTPGNRASSDSSAAPISRQVDPSHLLGRATHLTHDQTMQQALAHSIVHEQLTPKGRHAIAINTSHLPVSEALLQQRELNAALANEQPPPHLQHQDSFRSLASSAHSSDPLMARHSMVQSFADEPMRDSVMHHRLLAANGGIQNNQSISNAQMLRSTLHLQHQSSASRAQQQQLNNSNHFVTSSQQTSAAITRQSTDGSIVSPNEFMSSSRRNGSSTPPTHSRSWPLWNYFDVAMVIVSIVTLALRRGSSSLNALRAFRLLRVIHVLLRLQGMDQLFASLGRSVRDLLNFAAVYILFIFMYAIVGVILLKDKMEGRSNFDNLGYGMVTVFQVTTPENVNGVFFDAVQALGFAGGAIFTTSMLLIGHYVVEAIFVVILLSNFNTDLQDYDPASMTGRYRDRFEELCTNVLLRLKRQRYGAAAIDAASQQQPQASLQSQTPTGRQQLAVQMTNRQASSDNNASSLALAPDPVDRHDAQFNNNAAGILTAQQSLNRLNSQNNGGVTANDIALHLSRPPAPASLLTPSQPQPRSAMRSPDRVRSPQGRIQLQDAPASSQQPRSPEAHEEVVQIADDSDLDAALATSPQKKQQNASDRDALDHRAMQRKTAAATAAASLPQTAQHYVVQHQLSSSEQQQQQQQQGTIARMPTAPSEFNSRLRSHPSSSAYTDDFTFNDLPIPHRKPLKSEMRLSRMNSGNATQTQLSRAQSHYASQGTMPNAAAAAAAVDQSARSAGQEMKSAARMAVQSVQNEAQAQQPQQSRLGLSASLQQQNNAQQAQQQPPALAPQQTRIPFDRNATIQRQLSRHASHRALNSHRSNRESCTARFWRKFKLSTTWSHITRTLYDSHPPAHTSLLCLSPENTFRQYVHWLLKTRLWRFFEFGLITLSCVQIAYDGPALHRFDDTSSHHLHEQYIARCMNAAVFACFALEVVLKVIDAGLWRHKSSYLRSSWWHVFEFTQTFTTLVYLIAPNLEFFRAVQSLRAIRYLNYYTSTRIVLLAYVHTLVKLFYLMVFVLLVFLIFSIIAVHFLNGVLQQCVDESGLMSRALTTLNYEECLALGARWINPLWMGNFDSVGAALLFLFELCTEENWPTFMWATVDAPDEWGQHQKINNNPAICLLFCLFLVIGSLLIKNLFVGVIVNSYIANYSKFTGSSSLHELQVRWLELYKRMSENKPQPRYVPPRQPWISAWDLRQRRSLFRLVSTVQFEYGVMCIVAINVLVFAIDHDGQSAAWSDTLNTAQYVITWIYLCELCVSIIGLGPKQFWRFAWNRFDAIVILFSVVDNLASDSFVDVNIIGLSPKFFRILRLLRIIKFMRHFQGIASLTRNLLFTLPNLLRVGILFVITFFVFTIVGQVCFGRVKYLNFMDGHANFSSGFVTTFITLFRMMTGENWNGIMRDLMIDEVPYCDPALDNCGRPALAIFYCLAFQFFTYFTLLNLVTAVVLQQFEADNDILPASTLNIVPMVDLKEFVALWSDLSSGMTLPVKLLPNLLASLPAGVNCLAKPQHIAMQRYIHLLQIPCASEENFAVLYIDVLYRLCEFQLKQCVPYVLECARTGQLMPGHTASTPEFIQRTPQSVIACIPANDERLVLIRAQIRRDFPQLVTFGLVRRSSHAAKHTVMAHAVVSVLAIQAMWRRAKAKRLKEMIAQRLVDPVTGRFVDDSGNTIQGTQAFSRYTHRSVTQNVFRRMGSAKRLNTNQQKNNQTVHVAPHSTGGTEGGGKLRRIASMGGSFFRSRSATATRGSALDRPNNNASDGGHAMAHAQAVIKAEQQHQDQSQFNRSSTFDRRRETQPQLAGSSAAAAASAPNAASALQQAVSDDDDDDDRYAPRAAGARPLPLTAATYSTATAELRASAPDLQLTARRSLFQHQSSLAPLSQPHDASDSIPAPLAAEFGAFTRTPVPPYSPPSIVQEEDDEKSPGLRPQPRLN